MILTLFNRSAHSAVPVISVCRLGGLVSVRSGVSCRIGLFGRIGLLGWIGVFGWIAFFDYVLNMFMFFHSFFDHILASGSLF